MEAALFGTEIRNDEGPGFAIDCASQGKEGLEMVRRALAEGRPYALAFVDGRMPPGWDGIETIGRLRQASPDLQIVLCTAYSDYSWSEIRRKLGDSDSILILKKPFDNVEVLQLAHALTRKWELTRQVRGPDREPGRAGRQEDQGKRTYQSASGGRARALPRRHCHRGRPVRTNSLGQSCGIVHLQSGLPVFIGDGRRRFPP